MFDRQGRVVVLSFALALLTAGAPAVGASPPDAIERLRAAAALQQRGLFDLAAADYAAIEQQLAGDPLAARAAVARGVCLFQLGQFADARSALRPLVDRAETLSDTEREQLLATLGLASYNLGQTSTASAAHEPLEAAIHSLGSLLDQFPRGSYAPQAAFYRADALYARGRLDDAATAYRQLLKTWPQHPQRAESLHGLIGVLHDSSDFVATVAACQDFEREFAKHAALDDVRHRHASALLSAADAARQAHNLDEAHRLADELLHEFPESAGVPAAFLVIAQVQSAQRDLAAAEASLDLCLQRSTQPEITCQAQLLRARVRCERGDHAGCQSDATAALVREPHRPEALHLCGVAELGLSKYDAAIASLSRVLAEQPNYAAADRVLYDLAWAYEQSGQPQPAQQACERLIASYPQSPLVAECQFRLGQSDFKAERFAAAATHFRAAERSATDALLREKALHQLAWCHFEAGDHAAARQAFETQRHDYPAGPLAGDAAAMAGECCYQLRKFAAAIDHFARAVASEHAAAELRSLALVHASESAAALHEWKRSLEFADRAIEEFPNDPRLEAARYARGIALFEMGFLDQSQQELMQIASQQTGLLSLKADLALGRIHVASQHGDEAVRQFFKVAYGHGGKAAPESYHGVQAEAIFAAAEVLAKAGRQDAARKLYAELLNTYPTSDRAALARKSLDETLRR